MFDKSDWNSDISALTELQLLDKRPVIFII